MKTRLILLAFAFIVVCLGAAPAMAQAASPQHNATIPFVFHVGDKVMPAGAYAITQFGNRMQLRALEGGQAAIVTAIPVEARQYSNVGHLHFERSGDELVLSDVYFAGNAGIQVLNKKIRTASRM